MADEKAFHLALDTSGMASPGIAGDYICREKYRKLDHLWILGDADLFSSIETVPLLTIARKTGKNLRYSFFILPER